KARRGTSWRVVCRRARCPCSGRQLTRHVTRAPLGTNLTPLILRKLTRASKTAAKTIFSRGMLAQGLHGKSVRLQWGPPRAGALTRGETNESTGRDPSRRRGPLDRWRSPRDSAGRAGRRREGHAEERAATPSKRQAA